VDVAIGVQREVLAGAGALAVTLGLRLPAGAHDVRVLGPELHLVLAELQAPLGQGVAIELIEDQVERLTTIGVPVGQLAAPTPRELLVRRPLAVLAPVQHMGADERLQLGVGREAPDIADRDDEPRGDHGSDALDRQKDLLEHIEALDRARQLLVARVLLGIEALENLIVGTPLLVEQLNSAFRVLARLIAEDRADEVRPEPLFGGHARLHRIDASPPGFGEPDEVAVTPRGDRELALRFTHEQGEGLRVVLDLGREVVLPPVLHLRGLDAEHSGIATELFRAARQREGEPITRPAEDHGNRVSGLHARVNLGHFHHEEVTLRVLLDQALGLQLGQILALLDLALPDVPNRELRHVLVLLGEAPALRQSAEEPVELIGLGLEIDVNRLTAGLVHHAELGGASFVVRGLLTRCLMPMIRWFI